MVPRTPVMQCCKYAGHISVTSSRRLGWTSAKWSIQFNASAYLQQPWNIQFCDNSQINIIIACDKWHRELRNYENERCTGRSTRNIGKTSQQYHSGVSPHNSKMPPHTSQCTLIWSTPCTTHWNRTEVVQSQTLICLWCVCLDSFVCWCAA